MSTRFIRLLMALTLAVAFLAPMAALALAAPAIVLLQTVDPRSNYELWITASAILTTILSGLLLYVPQHWPRLAKQAVVAVIALLMSGVTLFFAGGVDPADYARTALLIFLGSTGIYVVVGKPILNVIEGKPAMG